MKDNSAGHSRSNFLLGVLNGTLVHFGLAFVDPFTVIPVFILRAGGSNILVGLAAAVYGAGWFLPQVFVARYVESRPRVLNVYRMMALCRVVAWVAVIMVVFWVDPARSGLFVWLVIVLLFANTLCAGVAGVPFLEVISRTITPERRGSFFGVRRFSGGILGIMAGMVVATVVGAETTAGWTDGWVFRKVEAAVGALGWTGRPFPENYGILIVIGAVLHAAGFLMFGMIREPAANAVRKIQPLGKYILDGFRLLRERPNYRLFFVVRICWQLTCMAFPFYAAYAYSTLGFSEASVGVFVSAWVGSAVLSNYVWGWLSDRRGSRIVLVLTAILALVPPMLILFVVDEGAAAGPRSGTNGWVFWLVASTFVLNGFARSGRFISNMTYLLEFAPEERRPQYVGFMNTLSFPFMLSPALGGAIVHQFSFPALFGVSAVFAVITLVLSSALVEPRVAKTDIEAGYLP